MFIKYFSTEPATSSLKNAATRENESLPLGYDWLIKKVLYHATIAQQTKRVKEQNTNQRTSRMYKSVKIGIRWSKDETFQSLLKTLVSAVSYPYPLSSYLGYYLISSERVPQRGLSMQTRPGVSVFLLVRISILWKQPYEQGANGL